MSARRPPTRLIAALALATITLLGLIAYVSYNALSGLPGERTYRVSVDLPDAQRLIATNDVRVAGIRVGRVAEVKAMRASDGRAFTRLELALETKLRPLHVGTTVRVRPASVLGATYVELAPSPEGADVPEGGALPASSVKSTVDLTDLFDVFDRRSAAAFQSATAEVASGLAGRGEGLNATLGTSAQFLGPLGGVMGTLARPATDLDGFLTGADAASAAVAPASGRLADLMRGGSRTFAALDTDDLSRTLDATPPAQDATIAALGRVSRPLRDLAQIMGDLEPGTRRLPRALTLLDGTYRAGEQPLHDLPQLTARLRPLLRTLGTVSRRPSTVASLRKLPDLLKGTNGTLAALLPAQTQCNVISLAGQNISSYIGSMGTGDGPAYATFGIATAGAQTDEIQSAQPSPDLHINYLPRVNAQECEPNNEPVPPGQVFVNPPTLEARSTRRTLPPPGTLERAGKAGLLGSESHLP